MRRRLAEGRLAEVFGADLVESDYVYRLFDPEKFARDSVATYPPEMRAQVDAFVGGINAYIDGHQHSLEPAFRLLGIKPAHYTAEDLEAGALTIAMLLGYNATEESVYINLAPKMAPSEIAALMPVYPSLPLEPPPPETTAVFGGAKLSFPSRAPASRASGTWASPRAITGWSMAPSRCRASRCSRATRICRNRSRRFGTRRCWSLPTASPRARSLRVPPQSRSAPTVMSRGA